MDLLLFKPSKRRLLEKSDTQQNWRMKRWRKDMVLEGVQEENRGKRWLGDVLYSKCLGVRTWPTRVQDRKGMGCNCTGDRGSLWEITPDSVECILLYVAWHSFHFYGLKFRLSQVQIESLLHKKETHSHFMSSVPCPTRGSTVVKVLCYKSEGSWFDPRWCQWIFH